MRGPGGGEGLFLLLAAAGGHRLQGGEGCGGPPGGQSALPGSYWRGPRRAQGDACWRGRLGSPGGSVQRPNKSVLNVNYVKWKENYNNREKYTQPNLTKPKI